jgi:hypothetical protein
MKGLYFFIFCLFICSKIFSQNFYDLQSVQKIEITFEQANWDYQMDTAKAGKEGYILAKTLRVNGETFNDVGVKYKGNSSYNPAAVKNPLHIELNTFKEQSYQGYTDIKLSNNYQDPSVIREVLAYEILQNYMDCPRANFAKVFINGIYYGLYSNVESINKKFYGEHFYSGDHIAIKANPSITPGSATKCNLRHIGNDSSTYFNYYELKSKIGWKELVRLCDSVTNHPASLENNLDMDKVIWMLAFNNALVNLDSYTGAFCQNYYLYKDYNNHFNPVIWDLNMCFGGFPFVGSGTVSLGSQSISGLQQLPINVHSTDIHWPLINRILANATYKKMYWAHLKTITNEMMASGTYSVNAIQLQNTIDTIVQSDPNKFFSYTQFQNGLTNNYSVGSYSVPGIAVLLNARNNYLQSQPEFTFVSPSISNISTSTPALNTIVQVTANISNATSAYFAYRFNYSKRFSKTPMYDDGLHNDGAAGDNIYGTSFQFKGNQVQYYIYAENNNAGSFAPARAEHEFFEQKILNNPNPNQVVINEFLAYNKSDVRNEFNLFEDWIELFNPTEYQLSLSNCYLSDTYHRRSLYAFPDTTVILPHQFLMVWADQITIPGQQLHANFKINQDGDRIFLSNGLGTMIDSVSFGPQAKDESYGRCPDGTGVFATHRYPTFGMPNCAVGIGENASSEKDVVIYPNPAQDYFILSTHDDSELTIEIINAWGQRIYQGKMIGQTKVVTIGWKAGLYFAKCGEIIKKIIVNR